MFLWRCYESPVDCASFEELISTWGSVCLNYFGIETSFENKY